MSGPGSTPKDSVETENPEYLGQAYSVRLLYRVEEAAEILALSKSTIFELLATGELKRVKIGRALRITASELERFVGELGS